MLPSPLLGSCSRSARSVLASVAWHLPVSPLASGSSGAQACHGSVRPPLIHEHQEPCAVEALGQPPPEAPCPLVALGGYRRLFLSGHSPGSLRIARLMVAVETFIVACSSSKASQCS